MCLLALSALWALTGGPLPTPNPLVCPGLCPVTSDHVTLWTPGLARGHRSVVGHDCKQEELGHTGARRLSLQGGSGMAKKGHAKAAMQETKTQSVYH